MRVGVLGGGLQGCSIALALADRGVKVTLFDKNNTLLSRAAVRQRREDPPWLHVRGRPHAFDR